ncbi:Family 51 glycoside hydrolase [Echinococcus multilocularis]|uniref:Family 51 glycoside hydrolase n=1 Tax=Echinococcus multilocularis TaxID=6211 RepID=A0A0S4MIV3_ECHMU|nr:Family 51 glycoside hydrolase [Echinococcus multilocularis]
MHITCIFANILHPLTRVYASRNSKNRSKNRRNKCEEVSNAGVFVNSGFGEKREWPMRYSCAVVGVATFGSSPIDLGRSAYFGMFVRLHNTRRVHSGELNLFSIPLTWNSDWKKFTQTKFVFELTGYSTIRIGIGERFLALRLFVSQLHESWFYCCCRQLGHPRSPRNLENTVKEWSFSRAIVATDDLTTRHLIISIDFTRDRSYESTLEANGPKGSLPHCGQGIKLNLRWAYMVAPSRNTLASGERPVPQRSGSNSNVGVGKSIQILSSAAYALLPREGLALSDENQDCSSLGSGLPSEATGVAPSVLP